MSLQSVEYVIAIAEEKSLSEAERILSQTDMNNMTPLQAFNLLSDLVEKVKGE